MSDLCPFHPELLLELVVVVDVLLDELEVLDELLLDEVLLVEVEPKTSRQHPWSLTASKGGWKTIRLPIQKIPFSASGRGYFGKGVPSLKLTAI